MDHYTISYIKSKQLKNRGEPRKASGEASNRIEEVDNYGLQSVKVKEVADSRSALPSAKATKKLFGDQMKATYNSTRDMQISDNGSMQGRPHSHMGGYLHTDGVLEDFEVQKFPEGIENHRSQMVLTRQTPLVVVDQQRQIEYVGESKRERKPQKIRPNYQTQLTYTTI